MLKAGRDTGSLINHVISRSVPEEPIVGMGATLLHWTDRSPATVLAISPSGKTLTLRADKATRVDKNGFSENQEYTFSPDPAGRLYKARKTKDGSWRVSNGGPGVALGRRGAYHDFSF